MLLNGDLERILNWLDKKDVTSAYNFLKRIFDFLILHSKESRQAKNCLDRIIEQACNEEITNYYCLCAITLLFPLAASQERKLIKMLANHVSSPEKKEESISRLEKQSSVGEALLFVVIRAIQNKQRKEANTIFAKVFCSQPTDYQFGYRSSYQRENTFLVLYSAVNAVLKKRKPNLGDFIPEEVREKLPKSALSKGPKKIEEAVKNLFSVNSKRKAAFDHESSEKLQRTINARVKPLLEISELVSSIITPSRNQTAESSLELLQNKISAATNYPYQDQKLFLAKIGFFAIFNATAKGQNWTPKSAERYAEWIENSELKNPRDLIEIVWEWSLTSSSQRAALKLSKHTCNLIKQETDTQTKIDNLAHLARAIWHLSKYEAGEIFKQGIELADKLGSEDYREIESLIHCAQEYNGTAFTDEELHNFNKICELNFPYEAEKFIWVGYGKALAKIGGTKALSIISRLADRDVISLEYTLVPLLSYLIEHNKLSAELACPLIGLDDVTECWNWNLSDFIANAFSSLSQNQKEYFAAWIAKEYDRTYTSSPPEEPLKKLKGLLKRARITIPNYPHFKDLGTEKTLPNMDNSKETAGTFNDDKEIKPIDFDPTDFEALNQDITEETRLSSSPYTAWRRCVRIINKLSKPDDAIKFTKLVSKLDAVPLEDRLKIYETLKDEWGGYFSLYTSIYQERYT